MCSFVACACKSIKQLCAVHEFIVTHTNNWCWWEKEDIQRIAVLVPCFSWPISLRPVISPLRRTNGVLAAQKQTRIYFTRIAFFLKRHMARAQLLLVQIIASYDCAFTHVFVYNLGWTKKFIITLWIPQSGEHRFSPKNVFVLLFVI